MEFIKGRYNFALTVFVPFDCPHNCPFCTSKKLYKGLSPADVEPVLTEYLNKAAASTVIQDVVFTGGEPMMDLEMLERLISLVPNKNVYINTLLLKEGFFQFVKMVNRMPQIQGINVSRHLASSDKETKDQVEDWCLDAFEKPVRINCVLPNFKTSAEVISFVDDVLARWQSRPVTVNFRHDYTTLTVEELHSINELVADTLIRNYNFENHGFCDVCDTLHFVNQATFRPFCYHRGLEHSSVNMRTKVIVNDAIVMPTVKDGLTQYKLVYDWDGSEDEAFDGFVFDGATSARKGKKKTATTTPATKITKKPSSSYSGTYSCGFVHC